MNSESVKSLLLSRFSELQEDCKQLVEDAAPFIQKCHMKCLGVTSNYPTGSLSGGQVSYYLQQYAEAMLDYTYHWEDKLTEEEFPEPDARERIAQIFGCLDKINATVNTVSPGRQMEEILGTEIAECLLWRRGALLYMYCSSVQEGPGRVDKAGNTYQQDLQKGIEWLQEMFKIRDPVLTAAPVPGDSDTIGLLKMGIYSGTHLLALMYIGELCHWYIKHGCSETDFSISARTIGREVLDTYVTAITTIPQLQGWNTDRAKELLKYFQT